MKKPWFNDTHAPTLPASLMMKNSRRSIFLWATRTTPGGAGPVNRSFQFLVLATELNLTRQPTLGCHKGMKGRQSFIWKADDKMICFFCQKTNSGIQDPASTPRSAGELYIFSASKFRKIELRFDKGKDSRDSQRCSRDNLFLHRRRRDLEEG